MVKCNQLTSLPFKGLSNYCSAQWHCWPDGFKSVRLYFSESFVVGKSHAELEESINDKRKSGGRMSEGPRSRNDIELRRPAFNGWQPFPQLPWRSSSRFKFWFSTFKSLTSFCSNNSKDTHTHTTISTAIYRFTSVSWWSLKRLQEVQRKQDVSNDRASKFACQWAMDWQSWRDIKN